MIYYVSNQGVIFKDEEFNYITVEESLDIMSSWKLYQFDTETDGKNPHIKDLLCMQFGNDAADARIVVDCTTVSPVLYKEFIESRLMIGQNLKFDLQFLFKFGIKPRKTYDIMVVEQFLYMGYPTGNLKPWQIEAYYELGFPGKLSFSLQSIVDRYLHIYLDKSVRGEIRWRGLDSSVIKYAAGDVTPLEKVMHAQMKEVRKRNAVAGAKLECYAVPAMAYMEWCGIKLDEDKWKEKMRKDKIRLQEAEDKLNHFVTDNPAYEKFTYVDNEGYLWTGFDLTPKCTINWNAPKQVVPFAKFLGFNVNFKNKDGDDVETVLEKELKVQTGINDEFLNLYFEGFKEAAKVVGTYGQGHLDLINPVTGRLHTSFKQIGAATGRMSSGGGKDEDLAKYKHLKKISLVNMQQLPKDPETRACFVSEPGYRFVSCDFSAEESRLGADIYDDTEMRKEFTERTGDTHAMFAWAVFRKQCEDLGCTSALEVKAKAKHWRDLVKSVEFAYLFGAAAPTIAKNAKCSVEQAQKYIDDLDKFFSGRTKFMKQGSRFVRNNGYVLVSPVTGHRVIWWDHELWKKRQETFNDKFWEEFRAYHKGTDDSVAKMVRAHFQAASKYDRYALNSPTQGTGAIIMKEAMTRLFNYIVDNGLFNKVKICVVVHDEINCEYPESLKEFPDILAGIMKDSAAVYCKSLPIPAVPEVSDHWIH